MADRALQIYCLLQYSSTMIISLNFYSYHFLTFFWVTAAVFLVSYMKHQQFKIIHDTHQLNKNAAFN